jgi:Na+/melibiose symporter-like transporter
MSEMNKNKDEISKVDFEIEKYKKKIIKLKKNAPFAIIGGLLFCFIYPYLPRRYGRKPLIEQMEYFNAVLFIGVIYFIIYAISYFYLIDKYKKEIETLKRRKITLRSRIEKN